MFVNYPNNPTAAVATAGVPRAHGGHLPPHGILLAYDNAYCDLTFDGYRAPSIFEIPGARDVALEFFSLSKSYSMTGWRIGFAVGRPELIGALTRVKSYVDTGPFLAVQKAGAAALDHGRGAGRADPRRAGAPARRGGRRAPARRDSRSSRPRRRCTSGSPLPAGVRVRGVRQAGAGGDRGRGAARERRSGRRARASSASR